MPLPPCPHCNKIDFITQNVRAYGWCEAHYDENGKSYGMETDSLRFDFSSQTLRCGFCGKVRRDLRLVGDAVVSRT